MRHPALSPTIDEPIVQHASPVPSPLPLSDGRLMTLKVPVGKGGFAEAWTVRIDGSDEAYIGKFLHPQACEPSRLKSSIERARNEARMLGKLKIPGVPRLVCQDEHQGIPYLLMERIQGMTMRELMTDTQIPLPLLLQLCAQTAETLSALHVKGVIHSDIKPENLLFGKSAHSDWRCWIIDFGLALETDSSITRITVEGQTIGTHGYLDPRHVDRAAHRDRPADVYALGATWYEWYAGKALFSDAQWSHVLRMRTCTEEAVCEQVFNAHIDRQLEDCASLSQRHHDFEALLRRMLRYESATHTRPTMAEALRALKDMTSNRAMPSVPAAINDAHRAIDHLSAALKPKTVRNRIIGSIAGSTALGIALLLGTAGSKQADKPEPSTPLPAITTSEPIPTAPVSRWEVTNDTLHIEQQRQLLLHVHRKDVSVFASSRAVLELWALSIEAETLCQILEHAKGGSSAGLPRRTYNCYLSREQDKQSDGYFLTTRGVLRMHQGKPTFFTPEELADNADEDTVKHLHAWPTDGKILDQTLHLPEHLEADLNQKAQTRSNEFLRTLQQKIGIRKKLTRK